MFRLICLNLDKKLSLLSVMFMLVSVFLIYLITFLNASFNLTEFELLDSVSIVISNFFEESISTVEIIGLVFIILLVELELFQNNDNFDSYFVSIKGKSYYFMIKIFSYIFIIVFYTLIIFLGILIIYVVRFNSLNYVSYIFECFGYYLLYFILYFLISLLFMFWFKNYFSAMLVFIYYWLCKIVETNDEIILAILPNIYLNIKEQSVSFNVNIVFIIIFLLVLILANKKIYEIKDLKIIS